MPSLIPTGRIHHALTVVASQGAVQGAREFCDDDPRGTLSLEYREGGERPWVILDFGRATVSGYTLFRVRRHQGAPVLRLSYANWREGCRETGDFPRGSCTYLGPSVDLPILPANPNRFELYTIGRDGLFIAPLIQGQQRFVQVWLDTPGQVELESLAIHNHEVHSIGPVTGSFACSDPRLDQLWQVSVWTTLLASLEHHDAWIALAGWLAPRKLEHGPDTGLSITGADWTDYDLRFTAEIRRNPGQVSAAGWAFRSPDPAHGYRSSIGLDGVFRLFLVVGGNRYLLSERRLARPVVDGQHLQVEVQVRGTRFETRIDGERIDSTQDHRFTSGRIGFWQPKENWALFSALRVVAADGGVLLADDFNGPLDLWDFRRTRPFIADGAKRDRLVWSGDLDWAARNVYYANPDARFMRESLRMLALSQTPEGFIHAAPYPEVVAPPASGDYGHFASDEFSAWFAPVLYDYFLFTGDRATVADLYPALRRSLDYLLAHCDGEHLFVQRAETSKHAGNLELGDVGRRGYINVLVWDALSKGAKIAAELDRGTDHRRFATAAQAMGRAIHARLWHSEGGFFKTAVEQPTLGHEASSLALSTGLANPEQARALVGKLGWHNHGKFQSLMIRGKFQQGFADAAVHDLFAHNWRCILENERLTLTTSECMGSSFFEPGWGDESHPDTAIAHLFSGSVVGIQPLEPGYRRCLIAPQPPSYLHWAHASVPTPHGLLQASWQRQNGGLEIDLDLPPGVATVVEVPATGISEGRLHLDGTLVAAGAWTQDRHLVEIPSSGRHRIELTAVAGALTCLAAPGQIAGKIDPTTDWTWKSSSSVEDGRWGLGKALTGADDPNVRGYTSAATRSPQVDAWIEIDFGRERALQSVTLVPQGGAQGDSYGFPVDLDIAIQSDHETTFRNVVSHRDLPNPRAKEQVYELNTVIGVPRVRRLRLTVNRVAVPAWTDPLEYRLQLRAIRFRWAE